MRTFEQEFDRLNDAQRRAVETIEGPVMVIAGPGTGKTQVVSMRVANILRRTHMRPGNILCLTFSASGATAMRERLRLLIGPDAYGVRVSTIHGFCNDIISEHPQVFEDWSALEQISDIDRYREVNAIIDQLMPHLCVVNRKHPYTKTRDLLGRFSQLKREGTADEARLQEVVQEYERRMASASREGTKAHERNMLAAKKFGELVKLFAMYQEMLSLTGRYDYDDMILYVLAALREEEWLLASLQERYQYILVDEFQDTNGAQYQFIEQLTTYATVDLAPNLFVVGDDDQAIYRFQGANLQNLLSFRSRFPQAPVIPLTVSYRSTQVILDAAGSLIEKNAERLVGRIEGLEKKLVAGTDETGEPPMLLFCPSNAAEPWMIADLVSDRVQRGITPDDIAVLTQTNGELQTYYDALHARGMPVQMGGKVNLLTHPLVRQLLAILRGIYRPEDTTALATAIACEVYRCHPADLGRLFHLRREREISLMTLLLSLEAIQADEPDSRFHTIDRLIAARDCLLNLHHKIGSQTVVQTIERVLKDCGLIHSISQFDGTVLRDHESYEQLTPIDPLDFAALQAFFQYVNMRACEQPHYSFAMLMNDLELFEHPDYGDLRLSYTLPHVTEHGVRLMTAHQSKGLEFHTVILTNFRESHWDRRRNPPSLAMPEDLLFGWEKEQKSFEQSQDERRVAFVAMTRAKKELIFTCPQQMQTGGKARDVSPSAFFAEAGNLPEEKRELHDPLHASTLLVSPVRDLTDEYRAFLLEKLETFHLSVSALNRFLEDPRIFLENDLLHMPQVNTAEFIYGNAVHQALKRWGVSVQERAPIGCEEFLRSFESHIQDREIATDAVKSALIEEGRELLPRYFEQRLAAAQPVIYRVESSFTGYLDATSDPAKPGIPLKGKIDRIDLDAPDVAAATVIDFKTGKPKTEKEIMDGDLYRQLVFYSLLMELSGTPLQPHTYVLDFIGSGPEHPIERTFKVSPEDRENLKVLIRAVWTKIKALDFTPLEIE